MITTVVVLILLSLLLIALETFVPGGILGTLGLVGILTAVALVLFSDDFGNLSSTNRTLISIGIIVMAVAVFSLWMKWFAVKIFHRSFNLEAEIATPIDSGKSLIGKYGVAFTDLRPLGKIELDDGGRYEVRLLNGHAQAGTRVEVVNTEPGNLVVATTSESPMP